VAAGEPIEFISDMLAGRRTAEVCCPVVVAGSTSVAPGDVVVSDVAVRAAGYWGDSARTYVNGGDGEAAEQLGQVREVLERARTLLVPGATGHDVHAAIAADLAERFPGGEFSHHAGHGLGMGPFEDPHLIPNDRTPLQAGMVIAVEPGIYFAGRYGLRVENVYVVAPGGGVPVEQAARADTAGV
jgi:Xaa-Pro aminopeptidase